MVDVFCILVYKSRITKLVQIVLRRGDKGEGWKG
jgi:hypothetical protein